MANANCSMCGKTKPEDEFYRRSDGRPRSYCKACYSIHNRQQRKAHKAARDEYDRQRGSGWERHPENREKYAPTDRQAHDKYLQRTYGITIEDFDAMLSKQDGTCAICDGRNSDSARNRRMTVDHDHETGKVRGLLCFTCNTSIGKLGDTYEALQKAADYLKGNK